MPSNKPHSNFVEYFQGIVNSKHPYGIQLFRLSTDPSLHSSFDEVSEISPHLAYFHQPPNVHNSDSLGVYCQAEGMNAVPLQRIRGFNLNRIESSGRLGGGTVPEIKGTNGAIFELYLVHYWQNISSPGYSKSKGTHPRISYTSDKRVQIDYYFTGLINEGRITGLHIPLFTVLDSMIVTPLPLESLYLEKLTTEGLCPFYFEDPPAFGPQPATENGEPLPPKTYPFWEVIEEEFFKAYQYAQEYIQKNIDFIELGEELFNETWKRVRQDCLKTTQSKLMTRRRGLLSSTMNLQKKLKRKFKQIRETDQLVTSLKDTLKPQTLAHEQKALLNFCKNELVAFTLKDQVLTGITKDIYIFDPSADCEHCLGQYRFELDLITGSLKFSWARPSKESVVRKLQNHQTIHPHILKDGRACLGNVSVMLLDHLRDNLLVECVSLVLRFLKSYNENDTYCRITEPESEEEEDTGPQCYFCGDATYGDYGCCDWCDSVVGHSCCGGPQVYHSDLGYYQEMVDAPDGQYCGESCALSSLDIRCTECDCEVVKASEYSTFQDLKNYLQTSEYEGALYCDDCLPCNEDDEDSE